MALFLTLLLFFIAIILTIVGLPGIPLIGLGVVIYGIATSFEIFSISHLITFLAVVVISFFVDNIAVLLGARKFGASKLGTVGAVVGGILGFLAAGPIGLLLGPFIGALGSELMAGRKFKEAVHAGIGGVLGVFIGAFLKFFIAIGLIIWFLIIIF